MKPTMKSLFLRIIKDERGQVIPMMAGLMLTVLFGLAALSVDLGSIYLGWEQLQASANAAALAGAHALPYATATSQATTYSSVSGNLNAYTNLPNVSMVSGYPKIECLATLTGEGLPCYAPADGNAVQVKQTVKIPLYFASLLGAPPVTLTATATASARGANAGPFNVVIILDTTNSMTQSDGSSECSGSKLSCALNGLQTLLLELAPCTANQSSCNPSGGIATYPVDSVSLFTFPNVTTATVGDDTNCASGNPTIEPYTFPAASGSGYTLAPYIQNGTSIPMTYQVTNFLSDYRTSDTAASLSASSALSIAAGAGGKNCAGLAAPGGDGTYYAGAIYAAQAALEAQQAAQQASNSLVAQNVIILLSDGQANSTELATKAQVPSGALYAEKNGSGNYPSARAQCGQAVTAALYAVSQGTRIYSVAYDPESGTCSTGDTYTPCTAMQAIASAPQYFFTDVNGSGADKGCTSVNNTTSLAGIFSAIGSDFTYARLIPNGTT